MPDERAGDPGNRGSTIADLARAAGPGSADAPVIHVRGVAYKGTVEISTRPPERPALRR
jgi:hypothetical protein